MKIEGRKKKEYSESLYGELFILAALILSGDNLPTYMIHDRLHKSQRTYRRYFKALHDCGLIPKIRTARSSDKEVRDYMQEEFTYYVPLILTKEEHKFYSDGYYFDRRKALCDILYDYAKEHANPQNRLYRLGAIIIYSIPDCWYDYDYAGCETDEERQEYLKYLSDSPDGNKDWVFENGELYHVSLCDYEDLYEGLTERSRQRDFKLIRRVIIDILSDHDKYGI